MTDPGDIQGGGTKVVPYYVVGVVGDDDNVVPGDGGRGDGGNSGREPSIEPDADEAFVVRRRRPRWLGFIAALLGLATLTLFIAAMMASADGDYSTGTTLAQAAIAVSIVGAAFATVCLIFGFRRRWAAFGFVLSVFANPLVVLNVLSFFSG